MTEELVKAKRRCGPCTACCTVMAVEEIEKPMHVKCPSVCSRGCRIYSTRPESCRTWMCGYLLGLTPPQWRPDKVGFVVHINDGKEWNVHPTGKARPWLDDPNVREWFRKSSQAGVSFRCGTGAPDVVFSVGREYVLSPEEKAKIEGGQSITLGL